jgi:hypothetical protein
MSDPVFYLRVSPTGVHSIGAPQRSPINEIEKVELLTRLQPAIASFDKAIKRARANYVREARAAQAEANR